MVLFFFFLKVKKRVLLIHRLAYLNVRRALYKDSRSGAEKRERVEKKVKNSFILYYTFVAWTRG